MEPKIYTKYLFTLLALFFATLQVSAHIMPSLEGPIKVGLGTTTDQIYSTDVGQTGYEWNISSAGTITEDDSNGTITVTWNITTPWVNQTVSVTYDGADEASTLVVLYYPFLPPIDATTIPQFVDPMPHFAANLRVDAKAGGNLWVKELMVQQVALSTGTVCGNGTIGLTPGAGIGNYAAYAISKDGTNYGPAMWPAQTIETQQGNQVIVQYINAMYNVRYSDFNILADQTLMMNGYNLNGNPQTEPHDGDIPMSVHLHGGEIPSNSDGGPMAWFTPDYLKTGPGFVNDASSLCTYPNQQEGTTLWYHPHDQGLTRINVYTGLAGFYILRGANENALHLPGWSGDGMVREVQPTGKSPTFNGSTAYLPEIELAIQDRMFNENGELYWPVEPTNPEVNPFWTPEFFGDVMTVNGKSWPYLSVAPRKYMFRMLDGCNARFLNLWLSSDPTTGTMDGPKITVISTEGGFLGSPVILDPALGQTLSIAPAERPIIIIDFTGLAGNTYTMMNDANGPYPNGDPIISGLTDRIMQFVVNGEVVSADNSVVPSNLRPTNPMVKLTNFDGTINVTPTVKRQLLLNEISGAGGPLRVAINNSSFDATVYNGVNPAPNGFGGPTETPTEGTTEIWQIINTTEDAHPMHPHLVQFQLVSRQAFNYEAYLDTYSTAWATARPEVPVYPDIADYPGGSGSPYPYNSLNADGAVGGNPAITPFLNGPVMAALPEEMGWKDAIKALPGQVETYMVRMAPTDKPINASPLEMVFPFDPSLGPGYVWHCHIIDHEDMDMMRPLLVAPSPVRSPTITTQPMNVNACTGWQATFALTAKSASPMSFQWQESTNGTVWNNLTNAGLYSNVTASNMKINSPPLTMNKYQYRCQVSTSHGTVTSAPVVLTVNQSPAPTLIGNSLLCQGEGSICYTTESNQINYSWVVSPGGYVTYGGTSSKPTVKVRWDAAGPNSVSVNYINKTGCTAASPAVVNVVVIPRPIPTITGPTTISLATGPTATYTTEAGMMSYVWALPSGGGIIKSGQGTNSITVTFNSKGSKVISVTYLNSNGCSPKMATRLVVGIFKSEEVADDGSLLNPEETVTDLKFEVYPVPNDGNFTASIASPVDDMYSIQIYNSIGIRIFEQKHIEVSGISNTSIDLRPVPPGMYTVVFINSQQRAVRKIIINR